MKTYDLLIISIFVYSSALFFPQTAHAQTSNQSATIDCIAPLENDALRPRLHCDRKTEIWLAPQGLPRPPQASNIDFMEMFTPEAPWKFAASHTQVFKLYAADLSLKNATQDQINTIVTDLKRRGIAIAVEVGVMNVPHDPVSGCGGWGNVEGYGTVAEAEEISRMIKNAGGEIKYIDMDEPFYYGHYYTYLEGKGRGCHSSVNEIVNLVVPTLNEYIKWFPDIIIGDVEPTVLIEKSPEWKSDLLAWDKGFQEAMGRPIYSLHLDVEWPLADGKQANGINDALALYGYSQELIKQNLLEKIGIIYNGSPEDITDEAWVQEARNNILLMEGKYGLRPEQIIFQSWTPNPTHSMPEWSRDTLTSLVDFYFSQVARALTGREPEPQKDSPHPVNPWQN